MERSEVLQRAIGILTQAGEWQRQIDQDADSDDSSAERAAVTALVSETLPSIRIPAGATTEEIAAIVGREVGGAIHQLIGAFSLAFVSLARVHDAGQHDISSADVLRDLALRAEEYHHGGGSGRSA